MYAHFLWINDTPLVFTSQLYQRVLRENTSNHISNGVNSHIIPSFGTTTNLGAIGNTTNGGLALAQDLGGWNSPGSDGRVWIGCMSCHGNNGAYRTLAYDSPDAKLGRFIAAHLPIAPALPQINLGLKQGVSNIIVKKLLKNKDYSVTIVKNQIVKKSGDIKHIRYDLKGPAHNGIPTPHKQIYRIHLNPNNGKGRPKVEHKSATWSDLFEITRYLKSLE
ncbi:polymorphic toxin type 24 domain-containing protein [Flavivirga abyssicola]|uniref:polymorphic toxin type 24 domain-containing protein n=1 Tax=Flavivirga abyssicola TaxID=3063533 RepID=UPI0026E0DBEE|nr:polymorphic toxin type 24 domain-containing protein [Flavivirga sp. MEBiC07777]WVK14922.1 polymorphic toxin type 24 domain-containing protein [Flavivirga sp. MEBiC07777]